MKEGVIDIVMRRGAEDLLEDIRLLLLLLQTQINQGKPRNLGQRGIAGSERRPCWRPLQVSRRAFAIQIVQNVAEQDTHRRGVQKRILCFHRPPQNLLDISQQPDAQSSWNPPDL